MIKKLRRKFILIVMSVVSFILLAIFFTMLLSTQKNTEHMSVSMLRQALNMHNFLPETRPFQAPAQKMRLPVLVAEIGGGGSVIHVENQLHFIEESEIATIVALAEDAPEALGVLKEYALRYLKEDRGNGKRIVFIDISIEQEILRTQIMQSLLLGGFALLVFFMLSLLLSHWAVRPVALAFERQKQFIGNASHELKTPLTVILSNADMLRAERELAEDKNTRRIEHIHAEALRMKRLVEDMLMLAKSESGEKERIYDTLDFSYIVQSVALMYEPILYDEGKKLSYNIEPGLFLKGDAAQLQQIMHILLDNAQKYTSPCANIDVHLNRGEHKRALLKVISEGSPIPKEDLGKLFLRFYRRDEARSAHESFGLGLSIAQSIVLEHKGSIWAESDGKGENRFCLTLPLS